jgi:signal transduction histidine kinase
VRSPQRVDVPALVEEVAAACRPTCDEAGCVFDVDLGGDELAPGVMGDEVALGRVFHNLIMNAAKHGAAGKWIGVSVSSCTVRGGREVCVTVRDRGLGIDAADLPHVFEPFRRGRRAVEQQIRGNGLGLSLVKRVVEAHGGRVAVTSVPGEGTSFVVYLPAERDAAESEATRDVVAAGDGPDVRDDGSAP